MGSEKKLDVPKPDKDTQAEGGMNESFYSDDMQPEGGDKIHNQNVDKDVLASLMELNAAV